LVLLTPQDVQQLVSREERPLVAADLAALARKLHFLREAALLSPFRFLHQLPTAAWGTTREGGAAPAADAPSAEAPSFIDAPYSGAKAGYVYKQTASWFSRGGSLVRRPQGYYRQEGYLEEARAAPAGSDAAEVARGLVSIVVLGDTGAGKSTLLNAILGEEAVRTPAPRAAARPLPRASRPPGSSRAISWRASCGSGQRVTGAGTTQMLPTNAMRACTAVRPHPPPRPPERSEGAGPWKARRGRGIC
jgi:hypothetical protein